MQYPRGAGSVEPFGNVDNTYMLAVCSLQWSIRINDQWRICFAWENSRGGR